MSVARLFCYMFLYGVVIATVLFDYPISNSIYWIPYLVVFAVAPVVTYLFARSRAVFFVEVSDVYAYAYTSIVIILYLLTKLNISNYPLLYLAFSTVGLVFIGLLNMDSNENLLLQFEPTKVEAILRGSVYGVILYAIASMIGFAMKCQVSTIGSISMLQEVDPIGELILMIFMVAIPEELLARVFLFKFGSASTDIFTASILTTILGYGLHAVTRYPMLDVLLVITAVWLLITVVYIRHGFLGSVFAHSIYNLLVIMSSVSYYYVIAIALFVLILWMAFDKVRAL